VEEKRSVVEKIIAFVDKYPLKALWILYFVLLGGLIFPPGMAIWIGKTEKVQLAGIAVYKALILNHCCLPFIVSSTLLVFLITLFVERQKAYKKEVHELAEEKKRLQELMANMKFPPSGNREV